MSVSIVELTPDGFGNLILYGLGEPSGFVETNAADPISFFPQTLGWLLISLLLFAYLMIRLIKGVRHWLNNRYRASFIARFPNVEVINFEFALYQIMAEARAIANQANPDHRADLFAAAWLIDMDAQSVSEPRLHTELGIQWMKVLTFERKKPLCFNERLDLLICCENWMLRHDNQYTPLSAKRGGQHGV